MHKSETLTFFKPRKDHWHNFNFKFPDIEFLPIYVTYLDRAQMRVQVCSAALKVFPPGVL